MNISVFFSDKLSNVLWPCVLFYILFLPGFNDTSFIFHLLNFLTDHFPPSHGFSIQFSWGRPSGGLLVQGCNLGWQPSRLPASFHLGVSLYYHPGSFASSVLPFPASHLFLFLAYFLIWWSTFLMRASWEKGTSEVSFWYLTCLKCLYSHSYW